jgi:[ribosomal protein S18]-alanine N-acetyltransferase
MTIEDQVIIREYKDQDKESVLNLLRLNTPKFFSPDEERDFAYYLENEIEYYFTIEINQQIVGSGGFNFSGDPSKGKISWDILHPNFQGKSLGRTLLRYRIEKLKKFHEVQEITVRTSQLVYKFYEKQGFKLIEIVEDYWAMGFQLYKIKYFL